MTKSSLKRSFASFFPRSSNPIERKTFFYDSIRQGIEGGGETLAAVLFLVIAIEVFQLPGQQKALIAASRAIAFCFAPFVPFLFSRMRRSILAGTCNILSGIFLLLATLSQRGGAFAIYSSLCVFFLFVKVPLFSQIYRNNYSGLDRGKLFGFGLMLRNICNLLLNILAAVIMHQSLELFRWVFMVYAVLLVFSGVICFGIPDVANVPNGPTEPAPKQAFWPKLRDGFASILRDRLFLYICFAWYILGFGNLALIPMRVEFLVNDFGLGTLGILFILQIVPGLIGILVALWGGRVFDGIPPLSFRIIINVCLALGTVAFFHAGSWVFLIASIAIFGLVNSGGQFVWNLWMTHLAPTAKDVDLYMGIHVFLAGTRGLIAPFVSYALLERTGAWGKLSLADLSWFAVGLVLLSTLLFVSMARSPRINRRA